MKFKTFRTEDEILSLPGKGQEEIGYKKEEQELELLWASQQQCGVGEEKFFFKPVRV